MTNCPACGKETAGSVSECPYCGVVFAKLHTRSQRQPATPTSGTLQPPANEGVPPAGRAPRDSFNRRKSVLLAVVVVMAIGAALWYLGIYFRGRADAAGSSTPVRAPNNAEIEEIQEIYTAYRRAFDSDDISTMKAYLVDEKTRELDGEFVEERARLARAFRPREYTITKTTIDEDGAILEAFGFLEGNGMSRHVRHFQCRRQQGADIDHPTDRRRAAYRPGRRPL